MSIAQPLLLTHRLRIEKCQVSFGQSKAPKFPSGLVSLPLYLAHRFRNQKCKVGIGHYSLSLHLTHRLKQQNRYISFRVKQSPDGSYRALFTSPLSNSSIQKRKVLHQLWAKEKAHKYHRGFYFPLYLTNPLRI